MRYVINNRGFTLAELVVSSGIAVLISSIATFTFSIAMDIFIRTARQYEAETEMLGALYAVKSTFAQSVNVTYGGDADAGNNASTNRGAANAFNTSVGKLFSTPFNDDSMSTTPDTFLVAMTVREMQAGDGAGDAGYPDAALAKSKFFGTGVFFQRAPANAQKSGALYVDQEINTTAGGGFVILSPVNAPLMFTRFTEFHVDNITSMGSDGVINTAVDGTDEGETVMSADFTLVMRYFTKGNLVDYRWCPNALMPQPDGSGSPEAVCGDNTRPVFYRDISRKVRVVFSNNAYDRGKYLVERPFGYLYFFKHFAPTQRKGI